MLLAHCFAAGQGWQDWSFSFLLFFYCEFVVDWKIIRIDTLKALTEWCQSVSILSWRVKMLGSVPCFFFTRGQGFVICKPSIRRCMMTNLACWPENSTLCVVTSSFSLMLVDLKWWSVVSKVGCMQDNPLGCKKKICTINKLKDILKCLFHPCYPFKMSVFCMLYNVYVSTVVQVYN